MNTTEFNEKYKDYLSDRHYGLDINDEKVIDYLDKIFPELIKSLPNFKYQQIKLKFGEARFYYSCDFNFELVSIIEHGIESVINRIVNAEQV